MMRVYAIILLASLAYATATKLAFTPATEKSKNAIPIIPAMLLGVLCHIFTLFKVRVLLQHFDIMAMMSLMGLTIVVVTLAQHAFNQYRLPIAVVAAFAALVVWLPYLLAVPTHGLSFSGGSNGSVSSRQLHIVLAMAAYVSQSFAGLYALLMLIQVQRLKRHTGLRQLETPLMALEKQMIYATTFAIAFLFLALVISSGFLVEKMTLRHEYKLLFGGIVWLPLSLLVLRYYFYGFRGQRAAVWILVGTAIAFLGYFVTGFMR